MKHAFGVALVLSSAVLLAACSKKAPDAVSKTPATPAAATPAPAPATIAAATTPAELSDEQRERAHKQALLDYAAMEDKYLNDPHAQWAASARASSTFGEGDGHAPSAVNAATNLVGPVDGKTWTNNQQDIGFDWIEVAVAKPVAASEVRVVFAGGNGVEAVSKLELQDTDGQWTTVWSGLSDVKADARGGRTWFVRHFDKTAHPIKAVKLTIANNVQRGYKEIDAVQLVGE